MRILLAYPAHGRAVDGIRDYATRMVEQLCKEGDDAVLLRPHRGLTLGTSLTRALPRRGEGALVIQYNPFAWGRWGFAPSLALALASVRLLRPQVRVLLAVHEGYVPVRDCRSLLMGGWQRAQVRILLALAHGAFAMTGNLTHDLSRGWPNRRLKHVPLGSNLPDERASRQVARRAAGYDGRLVVATLTTGHETHLGDHVVRAAQAVAYASPQPVILLLLGSNNVLPGGVHAVERIVAPGYLDARSLARALSTADLFLAPFADGATTRRTSLMAAMQHSVAIVTTASAGTEALLANCGALTFAAAEDVDGFAAQAVRLATNAAEREHRAVAGRSWYDRYFSWPAVCSDMRLAVAAASHTPA